MTCVAGAYAGVALQRAWEMSNSFDATEMRKAFLSFDFELFLGHIQYDENLAQRKPQVSIQFTQGQAVQLEPGTLLQTRKDKRNANSWRKQEK